MGKSWRIRGIRSGSDLGFWDGDIFFTAGFSTRDRFCNEDGGENERKERYVDGAGKGGGRTYEWMGGGGRLDWVQIGVT